MQTELSVMAALMPPDLLRRCLDASGFCLKRSLSLRSFDGLCFPRPDEANRSSSSAQPALGPMLLRLVLLLAVLYLFGLRRPPAVLTVLTVPCSSVR